MLRDVSYSRNDYFRPSNSDNGVTLELSPDVEMRLRELAQQHRVTNSFVIETALKQLFRSVTDGGPIPALRVE
jgi:hypothetical protein